MQKKWYALAVQPRKEHFVEQLVVQMGFDAICPNYIKHVRHARSTKKVIAPLYPGYIFVGMDIVTENWRAVNYVRGSIGLIMSGNRPSELAIEFVDEFISKVGSNGVIAFQQELQIGDEVQALGGPFHSLTGRIVDMNDRDRVKILLNALNRKITTTLPRTAVFATV
ncbi:MAG: transcription termination/antitermination NusG family protein [Pseudomonadota bacterium]